MGVVYSRWEAVGMVYSSVDSMRSSFCGLHYFYSLCTATMGNISVFHLCRHKNM